MKNSDLLRLLMFLGLGGLFGLVIQDVTLGLLSALILYLVWIQRKLDELLSWIRNRKEYEPPEARGVFEDISLEVDYLRERHKKRKKKLGSYLKQFQQATRALPDATIVLDEMGNVRWANKAAAKSLGVHWPDDASQRITNLIRTPELGAFIEHRRDGASIDIVAPNNKDVHLNIRLAPYGKNQWLFVARDVTQLHRAHEIRKDFVANVSHELRTPITVIKGYLEHFHDSPEAPNAWREALEQMILHTDRMESLVEDLLLLSDLDKDSEIERPETIAVAELVTEIQQQTSSMEDASDRIFSLELDPGLQILGSRRELYSAFSNLIINAISYTDSREVIELKWYRDDAGAHFAVKDHGIGIAEEHIPRLTERFYRVDTARARSEGGTGLGLAIVKHVLSRHSARLHIESELGSGSLFRCDFDESVIVETSSEQLRDESA